MARLRYIVDRPRGKRGGHNDVRHLYSDGASAKRVAAPLPEMRHGTRVIRAAVPQGRVFAVDIDALLPIDATLDERIQFHESQMLAHNSELERLRPASASPPAAWLTSEDVALIREAISEWEREDIKSAKKSPAAYRTFFVLRDLWREGKLGGPTTQGKPR